jgi:pimeloyl-ACP methyl ester carboxylesterase
VGGGDPRGERLMRSAARAIVCALLVALFAASASAQAPPRWMTLPPTPALPTPQKSGRAPVNGVSIFYATFGGTVEGGEPVLLLHGGLANSDYWGNQIPVLAEHHRVLVMDSRGHGRSTRNAEPFGYALMASDVVGLLDRLGIPKVAIVGWSDGAIIGLSLAMDHPDRVARLFAFAANSDPSGVKDVDKSPVFHEFIARAEKECEALSPTPGTWIVDADHDEAIKRENTEFMAGAIPGTGLLIQPEVSHFSMLQAPGQFADGVLHFLARKWQ